MSWWDLLPVKWSVLPWMASGFQCGRNLCTLTIEESSIIFLMCLADCGKIWRRVTLHGRCLCSHSVFADAQLLLVNLVICHLFSTCNPAPTSPRKLMVAFWTAACLSSVAYKAAISGVMQLPIQ